MNKFNAIKERRVVLVGCGSYLPEKVVTNDDLSKTLDTSHEWIFSRTGICTRHVARDDQRTSDLAVHALNNALHGLGGKCGVSDVSVDDIDAIIVATTTPDNIFPATATRVQEMIGMRHGFAFDVQAVCSGFLYALTIATNMVSGGQVDTVAVVGADIMSRLVDWTDRSTCILFGDGAGAFILRVESARDEGARGMVDCELLSDGAQYALMQANGGVFNRELPCGIEMRGRDVYKCAVSRMSDLCKKLLVRNDMVAQDVAWLIPHQANSRIMDAVGQRLGIGADNVVSTIAGHANTSAASIPLATDTYIKSGAITPGQLLLFAAAGAGMTYGSALCRV